MAWCPLAQAAVEAADEASDRIAQEEEDGIAQWNIDKARGMLMQNDPPRRCVFGQSMLHSSTAGLADVQEMQLSLGCGCEHL